jgi:hypothetical protein
MPDRIELEPEEIAGLIRGARLLALRVDTPRETRERLLATATTAMDALCGLCERDGTDAVWDVLELLHAHGVEAERDELLGARLTPVTSTPPARFFDSY